MDLMDESTRLEHYIGPAKKALQSISDVDIPTLSQKIMSNPRRSGLDRIVSVSRSLDFKELAEQLSRVLGKPGLTPLDVGSIRPVILNYIFPIALAQADNDSQSVALVHPGDGLFESAFPVLAKARLTKFPGQRVIVPLNYTRHFGALSELEAADRPWGDKQPTLIWRGAPTGPSPGEERRNNQSRFWVSELATRASERSDIDGAYTSMSDQEFGRRGPHLEKFVKPRLRLPELLEKKFLLSVEGNDVSSGLKWMMASNSCVLMPPPSVDSWFLESSLEPYVHYVPVNPDLSDVEEKLEWCRTNDSEARDIAQTGRLFASQFRNADTENELFRQVVKWFTNDNKIQSFAAHLSSALVSRQ